MVCVDNSIMAPTFQQPLALGADISMTSATKFLNGHSDIMGGILSVKGPELAKKIYFTQVTSLLLFAGLRHMTLPSQVGALKRIILSNLPQPTLHVWNVQSWSRTSTSHRSPACSVRNEKSARLGIITGASVSCYDARWGCSGAFQTSAIFSPSYI